MKFELNTDVLPVVSVDLYSRQDMLYEFDFDSFDELDEGIMEVATPIIEETITTILPSARITPTKVRHPRAYNFAVDELDFILSVDDREVEDLILSALNDDTFSEFLRKNYSSYDGFISYMAFDIQEFEEQEDWKKLCQAIMFFTPYDYIRNNNDDFEMDLWEYMGNHFDQVDDENEDWEE